MNAPIQSSTVGVVQITFRKSETGMCSGLVPGDVEVFEIRRAALRLDEKLHQHQAEQHAEPAENDERPAPAVVLADQPAEESARDRADIDRGLMRAHRARARLSSVIVADERHRSGKVKGLAQALRPPERTEACRSCGRPP